MVSEFEKEIRINIELGKAEFGNRKSEVERGDIYSEQGIQSCIENDQISAAEEGFMLGYLNA